MDAETEQALADVEWDLAEAMERVRQLDWWRSELLARTHESAPPGR